MGVCREATRTIRGNRESRGPSCHPEDIRNIDWVAKREAMKRLGVRSENAITITKYIRNGKLNARSGTGSGRQNPYLLPCLR